MGALPRSLTHHATTVRGIPYTCQQFPLLIAVCVFVALWRLVEGPSQHRLIAEIWLAAPLELVGLSFPGQAGWVGVLLLSVLLVMVRRDVQIGDASWWRSSAVGLGLGVLIALPLMGVGALIGGPRLSSPAGLSTLQALEAGVFEELVFRGVLLLGPIAVLGDWRRLPVVWILVASSVVFAVVHEPARTHWGLALFYVCAGGYLGLAAMKFGLWPVVVSHAAYDGALVWMQA